MIQSLANLNRLQKKFIIVASDALLLSLSFWLAIALRRGELFPEIARFYWVLLLAPLITIPVFSYLGLYRAVIRYMEDEVVKTVLQGVSSAVILFVAIFAVLKYEEIPRSTILIYGCISLISVVGSRMVARNIFGKKNASYFSTAKSAVIYGAGESGIKLASALNAGQHFKVLAFVDDNADLHGSEISGVRVYLPSSLDKLFREYEIEAVLLALPSATRKRRNDIIRDLSEFKVPVKTIPSMADLVNGLAKVDEIREVEIEDLLGRDTVQPVERLLKQCIESKSVMVTGAGGSIGSELCRQILRLKPSHLVLFEKSEFALYQIEQELNAANANLGGETQIFPILGSVTHLHRVEHVLRAFGVQTVYHAAAYKHVPLVEHNLIEGVLNNVFGTWRTADAARRAGVETFVLISTDKAVRPTNVMGASKRFAELVLQAFSREGGRTRYCMVRFGNVLGSSGSVVPLFKKQIQKGGPVMVTHPEITRYFMTIPEAAGLVLQAGAMGTGGDVFVLDMGASVKIIELAHKIIHLSGLSVRNDANPEGDIEIKFSGLRPGEKLYEELLIGDNVSGTEHPLIMRAEEVELPWSYLQEKLAQIDTACHWFDCETVRGILLEVVEGYQPAGGICDHVWGKCNDLAK